MADSDPEKHSHACNQMSGCSHTLSCIPRFQQTAEVKPQTPEEEKATFEAKISEMRIIAGCYYFIVT